MSIATNLSPLPDLIDYNLAVSNIERGSDTPERERGGGRSPCRAITEAVYSMSYSKSAVQRCCPLRLLHSNNRLVPVSVTPIRQILCLSFGSHYICGKMSINVILEFQHDYCNNNPRAFKSHNQ